MYSETCLQRNINGPNSFPVAGRFRFILVLEILMLGAVKVFCFICKFRLKRASSSVAAGEAAMLRACKHLYMQKSTTDYFRASVCRITRAIYCSLLIYLLFITI